MFRQPTAQLAQSLTTAPFEQDDGGFDRAPPDRHGVAREHAPGVDAQRLPLALEGGSEIRREPVEDRLERSVVDESFGSHGAGVIARRGQFRCVIA